MNRVVGIILFRGDSVVNKFIDTSEINFFIRSHVEKGVIDSFKDIMMGVNLGKIVSINFESVSNEITYLSNVICYCYKSIDGYSTVILTREYENTRIIMELARKLVINPDEYDDLEKVAKQYEDPKSVDKIVKTQYDLDITKDVLYTTIDKVLERGGNIEELVKKTDELSMSSQIFFKRAKRMNSCCTIL